LRKTAESLNLILSSLKVGTWDLSFETNIVSHDEVFSEIAGLHDGLIDRPFPIKSYFIHPDDIGSVLQKVSDAVETGTTYTTTYRLCRADGSTIWVEGLGRVIEADSNGKPIRMVGALRDVTESVTTRRKLIDSEENFSNLVESVPGAIFRCSKQGERRANFSYIGAKCEEVLELTVAEIQADPNCIWSMASGDDATTLEQLFSLSEDRKQVINSKFRITTRSGRRKTIQVFAAPPKELASVTLQTILVLDITEQAKAEKKLRKSRQIILQSQKIESLGSLTSGVAHDFNNLLAVVLGNLELLQEATDPARRDSYVDEAISATLRGADLTRKLLSFARKAPLTPVTMDLNEVLRSMDLLIRRAVREDIGLELVLSGGLWKVQADKSSTESTVLNLVINARDAMPDGGKITIETANIWLTEECIVSREEVIEPGRYVMIAVTDTGIGIPPENLTKVFKPFFTTKPVGQGTGLGLSSIIGFAQQSGGTVRIHSELGVGTSVKVYFRAVFDVDAPLPEIREAEAFHPRKGKVLLVEDEEAVRIVMKARLQLEGYAVVDAQNAACAIEAFKTEAPFDLILTDIVLPGELQGPDLVKALRVVDPCLKAIFMSGYSKEAAIHGNGLRVGDMQLMKPVSKDDLLRALWRALRITP